MEGGREQVRGRVVGNCYVSELMLARVVSVAG